MSYKKIIVVSIMLVMIFSVVLGTFESNGFMTINHPSDYHSSYSNFSNFASGGSRLSLLSMYSKYNNQLMNDPILKHSSLPDNLHIPKAQLSPSDFSASHPKYGFHVPSTEPAYTPSGSVNISLAFQHEPAPMGIADYGVTLNGTPYVYTSTQVVGFAIPMVPWVLNGSLGSYQNDYGIQLNAVMGFEDGGKYYFYWTQDVALISLSGSQYYVQFVDNIWNMTSPGSSVYNSTVSGSGSIQVSGQTTFYAYTGTTNPLNIEAELVFVMGVGFNSKYQPVIQFGYAENNGNVELLDTATLTFVNDLQTSPVYIVDGSSYTPMGNYFDLELVMGGPGGGSSTTAEDGFSNKLAIEYYNGNNYQFPITTYNYGSDTAETINFIQDTATTYGPYYIANAIGSSGSLQFLYGRSQMAVLNISGTPLNNGTAYLNSSAYSPTYVEVPFSGNELNVTLLPYTYNITIYSQGIRYNIPSLSLRAGTYTSIVIPGTGKFGGYNVTFYETGLPAGTSWGIDFDGISYNITASWMDFKPIPNGTYPFSVYVPAGYAATPSKSQITVNGANVNESIKFSQTVAKSYSITFTESGLPSGTKWYVNITNGLTYYSSTDTITFSEPNGTYSYTIATANKTYLPSPSSGSFTIGGNSVSTSITFSPVTYKVTFTEINLPSGTTWYVNISNGQTFLSSSDTITFSLPNGTYSYDIATVNKEYGPVEYSGSFTVNGKSVNETIEFNEIKYSVIFTETGLVSGISWSVTLGGSTLTSTSNSISFDEVNGSYLYTVGTVSGFVSTPSDGQVTVNGQNVPVSVQFSPTTSTYAVTFDEVGLPAGTTWSVTLGSDTLSSSSTSIQFSETDGTYTFSVTATGYTASPNSGSLAVSGSAITQTIDFSTSSTYSYAVTFTETGLAPGTSWSVTLGSSTLISTTSSISFTETNGTYKFTIGPVSGYNITPTSGTINVNGAAYAEEIQFTSVQGLVYVTGLVIPTNANLYINGKLTPTSNGYFNVSLYPGTYYIMITYAGYQNYTGTIIVPSGSNHFNIQPITLKQINKNSYFPWEFVILVLAIVMIASMIAAFILSRRRKFNYHPPQRPPF